MNRMQIVFWPERIAQILLAVFLNVSLAVLVLNGTMVGSRAMACDRSICDCSASGAEECPAGMSAMCKVASPLPVLVGTRAVTFCPQSSRLVTTMTQTLLPSQVASPDLPPPRLVNV